MPNIFDPESRATKFLKRKRAGIRAKTQATKSKKYKKYKVKKDTSSLLGKLFGKDNAVSSWRKSYKSNKRGS